MFQKFFRWVQHNAECRPFWASAIVTALLVHLLLLVLFRYAPHQRRTDAGSLAPMMSIDLSPMEYADLRRWVEYHDPALMTAADSLYGYSQFVREAPFRTAEEDLPRPPQLARPESGRIPQLAQDVWSAPEPFPVLESVASAVRRTPAPAVPPVQVYRNGIAEMELSRKLSEKYRTMSSDVKAKHSTEIAALPMAGRFRLTAASGIDALDRMALYEIQLWQSRHDGDVHADDAFTVVWPIKSATERSER